MAVLPGSLDYLYHNGILNHIPYEAYEMTPMTQSGMAQMAGKGAGLNPNPYRAYTNGMQSQMPVQNGIQYLQSAQQGMLYDTYTQPDMFVRRNNSYTTGDAYSLSQKAFREDAAYGRDADIEVIANGQDGKDLRIALENGAGKAYNAFVSSPTMVKGLLGLGIALTTLCCLVSGKKAPVKEAAAQVGLWTKFKNWLK